MGASRVRYAEQNSAELNGARGQCSDTMKPTGDHRIDLGGRNEMRRSEAEGRSPKAIAKRRTSRGGGRSPRGVPLYSTPPELFDDERREEDVRLHRVAVLEPGEDAGDPRPRHASRLMKSKRKRHHYETICIFGIENDADI